MSPAGDLDGTGESWEVWSLLPASDCQRKEEVEEAEGLEAFHLYLLGVGPGLDDTACFRVLASGSALGCDFSVFSAVPQDALFELSTPVLGLRVLREARGLFAEAETHL